MNKLVKLVFIFAIYCLPTTALSQVITHAATSDPEMAKLINPIQSVNDDDIITMSLANNKCYCCEVFQSASTLHNSIYIKNINASNGSSVSNYSARAGSNPAIHTNIEQQGTRACFGLTNNLNIGISFIDFIIGVNGGGAAADVRMLCRETTLYGGYNTNGTEYNFLELTNIMSGVLPAASGETQDREKVTVQVNAYDATTGQQSINQTISIDRNIRTDISIHDLVGERKFGSLQVCHNAPFGAIKATMSRYKRNDNEPASFDLSGREELTTRSTE